MASSAARQLSELLPKVGPRALPAVKMVLKQTSTAELELDAADYELLIRYWALHDPAAASSYAFGASPRGYRVGSIHAAIRQWMKVDPQKAIAEIRGWGRQEGDFGTAVQIAAVRGWYDSGAEGIEPYLRDLGPSFERQRGLSTYLVSMAQDRGGEAVAKLGGGAARGRRRELSPRRIPRRRRRADRRRRGHRQALLRCPLRPARRRRSAHPDRDALDRGGRASPTPSPGSPSSRSTTRAILRCAARTRSGRTWIAPQRSPGCGPLVADQSNPWIHPALPIYVRLLGSRGAHRGPPGGRSLLRGRAAGFLDARDPALLAADR